MRHAAHPTTTASKLHRQGPAGEHEQQTGRVCRLKSGLKLRATANYRLGRVGCSAGFIGCSLLARMLLVACQCFSSLDRSLVGQPPYKIPVANRVAFHLAAGFWTLMSRTFLMCVQMQCYMAAMVLPFGITALPRAWMPLSATGHRCSVEGGSFSCQSSKKRFGKVSRRMAWTYPWIKEWVGYREREASHRGEPRPVPMAAYN